MTVVPTPPTNPVKMCQDGFPCTPDSCCMEEGYGLYTPSHPAALPPPPAGLTWGLPSTAKAVAAQYQTPYGLPPQGGTYPGFALMPATPKGYCVMPVFGRDRIILGGPFEAYGNDGIGVCLERHASNADDANIIIDVPDFKPPTQMQLIAGVAMLLDLARNNPEAVIYVGCMGGVGRTGTFIAALAKVTQGVDGVDWVRKSYLLRAVETKAQEQSIAELDAPTVWKAYYELRSNRSVFSRLLRRFSLFIRLG